jgi:ElaB/YqjD/DUF883 family membrane-anchored ribosome-binding protein
MKKTQERGAVADWHEADIQRDRRSAEQIREDIEARRRRISSTMTELDSRVHSAFDWRGHASRHPLAAAGIAAGLGAATGRLLRRPRQPPLERVTDTLVQAVASLRSRIDDTLEAAAQREERRKRNDRPLLPAAFAATLARATIDFLADKVSESRTPRTERRSEYEDVEPRSTRSERPR